MVVPNEYSCYFEKLNGRKTLADDQTKLYLLTTKEMYVVKVDNGIIQNTRENIKKCDYLIYNEFDYKTHLIELKGTNIDKAFEQLRVTVDNIIDIEQIRFLLERLIILDAYIVSPERQKVPHGIESKERVLAKKLASRCLEKPSDILYLIKYVKVVPSYRSLTINNRHIICSNSAPLEFEME